MKIGMGVQHGVLQGMDAGNRLWAAGRLAGCGQVLVLGCLGRVGQQGKASALTSAYFNPKIAQQGAHMFSLRTSVKSSRY